MTNVSFTTRKKREKQGQRSKNDNRNRESCKVTVMKDLSGTKNGGWGRDRTADTRIFSPLLYQLSYPATFTAQGVPGSHRINGKRFTPPIQLIYSPFRHCQAEFDFFLFFSLEYSRNERNAIPASIRFPVPDMRAAVQSRSGLFSSYRENYGHICVTGAYSSVKTTFPS